MRPPSGGASHPDREVLEHWLRCPTTPQRVVQRSRIVLLRLEGATVREAAAEVGVGRKTVRVWWRRFLSAGPDVLAGDAPGRGRKCAVSADQETELAAIARAGRFHGERTALVLARRWGVSRASVYRTLKRIRESAAPLDRQF